MDFLREHKRAFLTVISIVCLSLLLITAGYKLRPQFVSNSLGIVVAPIQKAATNVGRWFEEKAGFFVNMDTLGSENERLTAEVEALTSENIRLKNVDTENEKLTELLNIDRKYADYPKVGAEIISKDPGNWYDTFLIDKGTKDGLKKDMVVLGAGGLAGRIVEAGYNYSRVVTLIDDTSSVSSKSTRTGDTGYVRGDINLMEKGQCKMELIDATADIAEGDEIVTSHLSSIYPPGITIGFVKEVGLDPIGTKYAIVEPVVQFIHMETIIVITELFDEPLIDKPKETPAAKK